MPSADRVTRAGGGAHEDDAAPPAHGERLARLTPAAAAHVMRARRAAAFVRAGRHAAAERLLRDVAAALMRRQAFEPCARVLLELGQLLLVRGRAGAARQTFADAVSASGPVSSAAVARDAALWEIAALTDEGRLDEAEARASAVAAAAPSRHRRAWAESCLARVALWRGDAERALQHLPQCEAYEDPVVGAWVEATAVRVLVAGQRLFEAGCRAAELRRTLGHAGPHALAILETARLRVLCESGDREAAAACLDAIAAHARAARAPLRLTRAQLVWLALLRRSGLTREADALVRRLRRLLPAAPRLLRDALERLTGEPPSVRRSRAPAGAVSNPRVEVMPELAGASQALEDLRRVVVRAAAAPFAVLIEGESGVGKELVARALHRLGPRAARGFCDVNCAALPDELVEAELFGHARGAFTGAAADRAGLFEAASGGTLFLDEVSELSARAQAKLLRAIQQQEIRRVGEAVSRAIDVRIVAAANTSMAIEAAEGRFRTDLLYRLDVIHLRVAPLRERPEDVPVLAEIFWAAAAARVGTRATLSEALRRALAHYGWPGNVRELQNVMAALAVAAPRSGPVPLSLLPERIGGAHAPLPTLAALRESCERQALAAALARAAGRRGEAARALGLTRQGLSKLMARLDVRGRDGGQT